MKHHLPSYLLRSLSLFAICLVLGSCSQEIHNSVPQKTVSYALEYKKLGFSQTIQFNENGPILSPTVENNISEFLTELFAHREFKSVAEIEVLFFMKEETPTSETIITLVGKGQDDSGLSNPIAAEFSIQANSNEKVGSGPGFGGDGVLSQTHSCTGAPCSCCNFRREFVEGEALFDRDRIRIVGCSCIENPASDLCPGPGGMCNHTITSG